MDFISTAYAMGTAQQGGEGGNPIAAFLPLILMFVIFYFLLIRPQQKKAKEHKRMLSDLQRGDHIITSGGIYGRITGVENDVLTVQLAENMEVRINRGFVSTKSDAPFEKKEK